MWTSERGKKEDKEEVRKEKRKHNCSNTSVPRIYDSHKSSLFVVERE